jgi:hypothetical protein
MIWWAQFARFWDLGLVQVISLAFFSHCELQ